MIPYQIQCATCRRSLTVRSAAAIGKILACPQCGSMVLVEGPPSGAGTPSKATPSESRPGTRRDESPDRLLEESLRAEPDPQHADTVPDSAPSDAARAVIGAAPPQLVPIPVSRTASQAEEAPSLRSTQWLSAQSRQMRRWLMIGAIAITGSVLLIVAIGIWLAPGRDRGMARVATDGPRSEAGERVEAPIDPNRGGDAGGASDPVRPADSTAGGTVAVPTVATPTGPALVESPTNPVDGPAGPSRPPADVPTDATAPNKAPADGATNAQPAATSETPLPSATPPMPAGVKAGLSTDAIIREFDGLMSDSAFDRGMTIGDSLFDLIPAPGRTFDMSRAMPKPPPARAINVDAQLAIRIPELEFHTAPLHEVAQFVSDFTNVPITLDVDGLLRLGLSARTPVDLVIHGEDIRAGVERMIEPLGLELLVDGNQLVILPRGSRDAEERTFDLFDLVHDDPAAAKFLSDLIIELLAPPSWEKNGGQARLSLDKGRLAVVNTPALNREVLLLCERLRIARGNRPQGELPEHMLELRPRVGLALAGLKSNVSANFPAPVPLTDILRQLAATSGIDLVVNWYALLGAGWNSASLARLDVNDVSLSEALQQLLGPMELSFRVIDATTVQITTADEAFRMPELEIFRLEPVILSDDGRRLTQALRAIIEDPAAARIGPRASRFDAGGKTLIVAGPQNCIAAVAGLLERLANSSADRRDGALPVIE